MAKNQQELFFNFLNLHEKNSSKFTLKDILEATTWKKSTFTSYDSKGQLSDFISPVSKTEYVATNTLNISLVEFQKKLSQSKNRRGLGHNCRSLLAKALLKKSSDNMLLAIELYNRPSLINKLDSFSMLFCCAWEQLLKAIIIEKDGEQAIYKKTDKDGIKKTISLRECLPKVFSVDNKVKLNIEAVTDLRDQAVHLLMPELQGVASRIFQSGILNYSSKFEEFTEVQFINSSQGGMISLVADFKTPPLSIMKSTYGKAADEILALAEKMSQSIDDTDDMDFAIPLNVELSFTRKNNDGSQIILTKADSGAEGLKRALVIHKSVGADKTHPYLEKDAIKKIQNKLNEKFTKEKLCKCLVKFKDEVPVFNRHCFQSVIHKEKWKTSNNEYHHYVEKLNAHLYSDAAVNKVVEKITQNDEYLGNAKEKYTQRN
ncbi:MULTISPECIES: DUF3644 domain-containing protein [unclassified Methylophaga]|mgnify:FL=1|jgi:hypothetical protein|uniref:DUF3644 domain-containing protein n=1 Tax=unclassified Methylophaga TaxID=2629249 RepID=UPI000C5440DC|nr:MULTISPECIES: DUF3644 domain-containing protein [unclassified Methylophaga]MAL50752.1 hypothetical protein [Methylophaga sp.]MBP26185.1 hypothetical protein [Methylophaga sp.]HCC81994.1 DUF3644 domain-containing protein [Methylophaga sp.]|tara:strand:+ start:459 stop:1751 length:1293 start_codon:yes stop_codon:yes gene_type:complete